MLASVLSLLLAGTAVFNFSSIPAGYNCRVGHCTSVDESTPITIDWGDGTTGIVLSGTNTVYHSMVAPSTCVTISGIRSCGGNVKDPSIYSVFCVETKNTGTTTTPKLGDNPFHDNSVTSVVLTGIEEIGSHAFARMHTMTSISIPEGVWRIGYAAIHDCDVLTAISLPSSLRSVGSSIGGGCPLLESVTIGSGNELFQQVGTTAVVKPDWQLVICASSLPTGYERCFGYCVGNLKANDYYANNNKLHNQLHRPDIWHIRSRRGFVRRISPPTGKYPDCFKEDENVDWVDFSYPQAHYDTSVCKYHAEE